MICLKEQKLHSGIHQHSWQKKGKWILNEDVYYFRLNIGVIFQQSLCDRLPEGKFRYFPLLRLAPFHHQPPCRFLCFNDLGSQRLIALEEEEDEKKPSFAMEKNSVLGGGFKYFLFSPLLREMIQF